MHMLRRSAYSYESMEFNFCSQHVFEAQNSVLGCVWTCNLSLRVSTNSINKHIYPPYRKNSKVVNAGRGLDSGSEV